jgi:hypothetical protein
MYIQGIEAFKTTMNVVDTCSFDKQKTLLVIILSSNGVHALKLASGQDRPFCTMFLVISSPGDAIQNCSPLPPPRPHFIKDAHF